MAVTALSRWKGSQEDMMRLAGKMKVIHQRLGADSFRLGRFHVGANAGNWLVGIRYSDWTSYGKAKDAGASDDEYQATYAEVIKTVELLGSSLVENVLE